MSTTSLPAHPPFLTSTSPSHPPSLFLLSLVVGGGFWDRMGLPPCCAALPCLCLPATYTVPTCLLLPATPPTCLLPAMPAYTTTTTHTFLPATVYHTTLLPTLPLPPPLSLPHRPTTSSACTCHRHPSFTYHLPYHTPAMHTTTTIPATHSIASYLPFSIMFVTGIVYGHGFSFCDIVCVSVCHVSCMYICMCLCVHVF